MDATQPIVVQPPLDTDTKTSYSVEFFHIYTDEQIGPEHTRSLEYLLEARGAWNVDAKTIVLIDNYNPTQHILTPDDVFNFLDSKDCMPDYWAYEGDLLVNAEKLLSNLTNAHLERNYRSYIIKHDKYPCSLLTATWYLTRLGLFGTQEVIKPCGDNEPYKDAKYLINILPEVYKPIEKRAHELIASSRFAPYSNYIQALFYPTEIQRSLDLF